MRNHRISLQDIATLAGVTKMTVSRYIRSPKKVAKETGERIAKIMEEINYIPNDILAGIESVTSVHNYQTLIANYNYDRDSEEESVINLLSYNIDGIILSEKYHTIRTVKFLRSATIPVVELMDVQGERLDMEVGFDNRQAAFDMVCTMLDKRVRRKILYLGSKDDTRDEQRYQGYCDAMMLHNLS
ncbi:LacI family DNA-binding transcriptional regulator, partial [Escherichia coli]|uniref:LacI family DNA-binding transcriptional regulator n=1 Tax=Escherichia coli TaxID=562 RepID=UPI001354069C